MDETVDLETVPKEPYKCAIGKHFDSTQFLHLSKNPIDVHTLSGVHSGSSKQLQLIPYNTSSLSIVKEIHKTSVSYDEHVLDQIKCDTDHSSPVAQNKPLARVFPLMNDQSCCDRSIQTDSLSIDLDSIMHLEDFSRSQRIYGLRSKLSHESLPEKIESLNQKHSAGKGQQLTELVIKNQELESLLKTQLKINGDLKKMLVSSVGEDCTQTCEQLSRECCQLRTDLTESRLEFIQLQEKYDQLSIEADMWKSKFIAGRVMVEELASWKCRLTNRYSESVTALQVMSQEMHQMFDSIKYMHRVLISSHEAVEHSNPLDSTHSSNMIDLANQCRHLLDKSFPELPVKEKSLEKEVSTADGTLIHSLPESRPSEANTVISTTQRGSLAGHFVTMLWRQLCSGGLSSVKYSGTTPEDNSIPLQMNCSNSTSTQTNMKKTATVSIVRETKPEHFQNCTLGEKLLQQVLYHHSLLTNDPTYRYHSGYNSPSSQSFERLSDSCKQCRGEITIL